MMIAIFRKLFLILVIFLGTDSFAVKPLRAVIYQGPGACDSCSTAAAAMAELAGFEPYFVGPNDSDPERFRDAGLYIQPGGTSLVVSRTMVEQLKQNIVSFVSQGGGYVGFCAGAFFATKEIRNEGVPGLGLFPGRSWLWNGVPDSPVITKILWGDQYRDLYWEGGPYMEISPDEIREGQVELVATYRDGSIAAARSHFGQGRVFVTGVHPEAPEAWRSGLREIDSDGVDWDLAVEMLQWVALR